MNQPLHNVFKALSHPIRLDIVRRLIHRVYICCEINQNEDCPMEEPFCEFGTLVNELEISKSSLSLHLKELRQVGLVDSIKDGRRVSIQINPDLLEELREFFELTMDELTEKRMEELSRKSY